MQSLRISRILHAGYVFECDGARIAFDPIFENPFSRNCHAFPEVRFRRDLIRDQRFAAVFISHFHDDHCSFESLDLLDRDTPLYVFCVFDELFGMLRELGFRDVRSLQLDVPVVVGAFEVTPRRALDEDVDSLLQVRAAGLNVLNVVDSWIGPSTMRQLVQERPWDLVLWPFQTMREMEVLAPSRAEPASRRLPPEWIEQLELLNPRFVVPSSCQLRLETWSWYNQAFFPITYRQFQHEVEATLPRARVVRMNPSISVALSAEGIEAAPSLPWVEPVGDQDVDYDFVQDARPPTTAEIARHFDVLTAEQQAVCRTFLTRGLVEKFRKLEPSEEDFFQQPRLWMLRVFDHDGRAEEFCFRIEGSSLEPMDSTGSSFHWLTEVPMARLWGALAEGESLTSMYVRINDATFPPPLEEALRAADTLADPLIRVLFTNTPFASYQRAQLEKIRSRSR